MSPYGWNGFDACDPAQINEGDSFHCMYAIFHSPTCRMRYAEFLKIDLPRLPLTSNRALCFSLVALGGELIERIFTST